MHGQQNIEFSSGIMSWCYWGRFHTVCQSKLTCWFQCYFIQTYIFFSATGTIIRQHHKKYL